MENLSEIDDALRMNAECRIDTITVYTRGDDILIDGWVYVAGDRPPTYYKYTWNGEDMYLRGVGTRLTDTIDRDLVVSQYYREIVEKYIYLKPTKSETMDLFYNFFNDLHRAVNQFVYAESDPWTEEQ